MQVDSMNQLLDSEVKVSNFAQSSRKCKALQQSSTSFIIKGSMYLNQNQIGFQH